MPSRWRQKLAVKVDEHNIGYMPIAAEGAAQRRRAGQEAEPERSLFPAPRAQRRTIPTSIANRRFHAMNKWPADLPGFRETTLAYMRHARGAVQQAGAALCAGARPAGDYFDACFAKPHMILRMSRYPVIDGRRRDRRQPGAAHRFRIHDLAAAQQGAGPVDPAARRPLDGCARRRRCLRRQWRRHPASLDQRAVPVDAAPRAQRLGPSCATPSRSSATPITTR